MHRLEQIQEVAAPAEEVWEFVKKPGNLNRITPEDLQFEIVGDIPDEMYEGLLIEYRIKVPVFGRWAWVTEIKHIREGVSFVDEQRFGPYKFWYHYHEVSEAAQGTRMIDRVHYKMPYGLAGKLVHALSVRKTLQRVFDYRRTKIEELFC